jgi:hypothetical protein
LPEIQYATVPRLFPGGTVVCMASGPSLTPEDAEYVRGKADGVIVVNTTYKMAPWADILVGSDVRWWNWHKGAKDFAGLKFATSRHVQWSGVKILENTGERGLELDPSKLKHGQNSGYKAVGVAFHTGASRIILLGYDMKRGGGKARLEHWHGDHPIASRSNYPFFVKVFRHIAQPLKDQCVEVINCTPDSALDCFPMADLRDVLKPRAEAVAS